MPRIKIQREQGVQDLRFGVSERAAPLLVSNELRWAGMPLELHRAGTTSALGEVGPVDGEHGLLVILDGRLNIERRVPSGVRGRERADDCGPGAVNYLSGRHRQLVLGMRGEASVLAVHLPDEWFQRMELSGPPLEFGLTATTPEDRHVVALLSAIVAEVEAGGRHGRLYAESLSIALLARVLSVVPRAHATPVRGRLSAQQCRALREYFDAHLGRDLSLVELSKVVQLSPRRFGTLFRWAFGSTPHQYLLAERMRVACTALRGSRVTAAELATQLGFSSGNHFASTFRRLVGVTPQGYAHEWRRFTSVSDPEPAAPVDSQE